MPSLLAPMLFARQNPFDDVKTTLSSWDNCMAKSYCKCVDTMGPVLAVSSLLTIPQVASHCRNHHRRPHSVLRHCVHRALHMLRRRVGMLLL